MMAMYSLFNKLSKGRSDCKAFPANLDSFKHARVEKLWTLVG